MSENNEIVYLNSMLSDNALILSEERKRKKKYFEKSVALGSVNSFLDNGWEIYRKSKTKSYLRMIKSHDILFKDMSWCLFSKMKYSELSKGYDFFVNVKKDGSFFHESFDILAKDEETVVVAKCLSNETISKNSLRLEIEYFNSIKGLVAKSITQHYGREFKPKILWLIMTNNFVWSSSDKQFASKCQIRIITERELSYLTQIVDHLGFAGRYQFLAEYFKGQKIPGLANILVPATTGRLGNNKYYSFIATPRHLLKIAFVNHRSLNDPEGVPTYQRLIKKTRLRSINDFLYSGGYFPTNILVNFKEQLRFDLIKKDDLANVKFGMLHLPQKYQSAWIIDGQHRLFGYAHMDDFYLDQNILVVAFENLSGEDEANLFVTINHEQKTVPKSLLDELEGELKWGSSIPSERIGAMSARLIGLLNQDIGGPFYNRVTQQGIPATPTSCLTTPQLKDGLRKSGLLGKSLKSNTLYSRGFLSENSDLKTVNKARETLNLFFSKIVDANKSKWLEGRTGKLCHNISVQAFFRLLNEFLIYVEKNNSVNVTNLSPDGIVDSISFLLNPLVNYFSKFGADEFELVYGAGGPPHYFFQLSRIVKMEISDFDPAGYETWEFEQSKENILNAENKLKDLNRLAIKYIFQKFKLIYGSVDYYEKGVVSNKIKSDVYTRSLDDDLDSRLPIENYLHFIDLKKIISGSHWDIFKSLFNIPEEGVKGKVKNLDWMDRVNKLRRIPAHQTDARRFVYDDFKYIDWIWGEFTTRLKTLDFEVN